MASQGSMKRHSSKKCIATHTNLIFKLYTPVP